MKPSKIIIFALFCTALPVMAGAQAARLAANRQPTTSLMGPLGLNTVPSARMDSAGTVRAGTTFMDPYVQAHIGMQIAKPLYISLRQTALSSDIDGNAERLYPGVDFKLRLLEESAHVPEIAIGLQSAFGHKRMAAEYLAATKRYGNFDFTGGMAWGRLGSAAHVGNPLKSISEHFGKKRDLDGEMPNEMRDWFTGEDIGFFAGVEYFPPWADGLSFKADWGADRYVREAAANGYNAPKPWSVGLNLHTLPWMNVGAALVGGEMVMGTVTFQGPFSGWPLRDAQQADPVMMRPYRTGLALPDEMERSAAREDITLYDTSRDIHRATSFMEIDGHTPLPQEMGRAARHMANHAGESVEALEIVPTHYGLRGPMVRLMRTDLERAFIHGQGSPQEIWRNTEIVENLSENIHGPAWKQPFHNGLLKGLASRLSLVIDNRLTLSEEENGALYRSSAVLEEKYQTGAHVMTGGAFRLDLKNNLYNLNEYRLPNLLPVRGNEDRFADQRFSLDRLYTSYLTTLKTGLHAGVTGGYLEEMYSGLGGEILYRPWGKTFAIGADLWQVLKREPDSFLEMGFNGDHILSGHVNAWYEFPASDMTLQLRAGRYLAGDVGGTVALEKRMDNGVRISGFVTATDQADFDVFGGTTNLYSGLQLSIPLGSTRFLPPGSRMDTRVAPLGRNTGQALDAPLPLYEVTDKLSTRHISRQWPSVAE